MQGKFHHSSCSPNRMMIISTPNSCLINWVGNAAMPMIGSPLSPPHGTDRGGHESLSLGTLSCVTIYHHRIPKEQSLHSRRSDTHKGRCVEGVNSVYKIACISVILQHYHQCSELKSAEVQKPYQWSLRNQHIITLCHAPPPSKYNHSPLAHHCLIGFVIFDLSIHCNHDRKLFTAVHNANQLMAYIGPYSIAASRMSYLW